MVTEWFGGGRNSIEILVPVVGICVVLIASKVTDVGRSGRYFLPAFTLWFAFQLLIGLEEGPLVSFPHPIGLIGGISLWIGSLGSFFRGLFAVWQERRSSASSV